MKIMGWVESVTFMAVVAFVSHFWGLFLLWRLKFVMPFVFFFAGNFERKRENMDKMQLQHGRYLS